MVDLSLIAQSYPWILRQLNDVRELFIVPGIVKRCGW